MRETIRPPIYETHGNPAEVLQVVELPLARPAASEVVVEMRAAPINPADLNSIEGKYPITAGVAGDARYGRRRVGGGNRFARCAISAAGPGDLPHSFGTWREALP